MAQLYVVLRLPYGSTRYVVCPLNILLMVQQSDHQFRFLCYPTRYSQGFIIHLFGGKCQRSRPSTYQEWCDLFIFHETLRFTNDATLDCLNSSV